MNALWIALGGAGGALARYGVYLITVRLWGEHFPWGTLTVNLFGSLLMGLITILIIDHFASSPALRALLLIGFLGAFTTFSSFAMDSIHLMTAGNYSWAAANVLVNSLGSLAAAMLGITIGRYF